MSRVAEAPQGTGRSPAGDRGGRRGWTHMPGESPEQQKSIYSFHPDLMPPEPLSLLTNKGAPCIMEVIF